MSTLGEPLSAEVELFAEKNEIGSLSARLASSEAFGRAGLIYASGLADVKVSVEKRTTGEPFVRLSSTQPFTEPFVDLLIELTWSSGRISREFTALLDPPAVVAERARRKEAEAQVRAAPRAETPKAEPMPETPATAPRDEAVPTTAAPDTSTAPQSPTAPETSAPSVTPPQPSPRVETIGGTAPTMFDQGSALPSGPQISADAYGPVRTGDTLGKIARAVKQDSISLDQMLVLLFRKNPEAFAGGNMNRLKTGKILQVPSSQELDGISPSEARKEVLAQSRDWNAYREQLAGTTARTTAPEQPAEQSAAGKVTTTVKDPAATAKEAPKEVLKLSKNEAAASAAAKGAQDRVHALEEEVVARDKAVKEANERVAKLEKTIKDLQALMEVKSKAMSDLQKPAPTTPAPPKETKAGAPTKPASEPPAPVTAAPEVKGEPAAPATPVPEPTAAPVTPPPAPAKPKPVVRPPAPAPEPSLIDKVMEQSVYIAAGLGALLLIGGLVVAMRKLKRRREAKAETEESGPATVVSGGAGAAAAYSGGTSSNTGAADAGSRDSEEVDPVAEAEIFLAYGRDAQAEELLNEALATSPKRFEIHLKLLEIYAKRKDGKAFEKLAREMQQGTGGSGPFWDQAVRLGYQLDPDNSRYAAGRGSGVNAGSASAASSAVENVDFDIGPGEGSTTTTTDFDLGDSPIADTQVIDPTMGSHDQTVAMQAVAPTTSFNIDLPVSDSPSASDAVSKSGGLDFDIDLNSLAAPAGSPAPEPESAAGNGLDFDISGLSLNSGGSEAKIEPSAAAPEIDLSGISLDLGTEPTSKPASDGKDDRWYDVQTKFDLAKAYQEMGDKDGAREILREVLQEGDAEQKSAAQAVLASLGS